MFKNYQELLENYKYIIAAVVVIVLLNRFVVNRNVENMAPVGHINMKHWSPNDNYPSTENLMDLRNNELQCNKETRLGCDGYGQTIPMNNVDEYTQSNYNPVHLDATTYESEYTKYVGDEGQPELDKFAGITYN